MKQLYKFLPDVVVDIEDISSILGTVDKRGTVLVVAGLQLTNTEKNVQTVLTELKKFKGVVVQ